MKKCVALLLAGLFLAGCSRERKPEALEPEALKPEAMEAQAFADTDELFMKVDMHYQEGNVDGAIDTLNRALGNDKYKNNRQMLFARLLGMMLEADRADDAKVMYLEVVGTDEELTRGGFGIIYGHYLRAGDADVLFDWTETLVNSRLPADLFQTAFAWHIEACRNKGAFDKIIELVPICVSRFDGPACCGILAGLMQTLVASEQYDEAERLLRAMDKESANRPELQRLGAVSWTDLLFLHGRWAEAEEQFLKVAPSLPDEELVRYLRREAPIAIKAGQLDLVDRLCGFVLKDQEGKDGARREAGIQCMAVGKESENAGEIARRLESLLELGLPPDDLLSLYRSQLYFVMQNGKPDDLKQMLRFGDRLTPLLTSEDSKEQITSMALDLSFMAGDYERSLKILDEDVLNRDKDLHDMSVNKIKAHLALKQGNKKEAIERFRKFMEHVSEWDSPEYDPISGLSHTREMCLGFNARRIGDILSSMGDEKGAGEAYEEAKTYYGQALKETDQNKKEYERIEAELAKIPAPGKSP